MKRRGRRGRIGALTALAVVAAMTLMACRPFDPWRGPVRGGQDTVRYILPPGNFGGLPTTKNSTDQIALYDALTPLRDHVSDNDIYRNYLPEDFKPVGATTEEITGHAGVRIDYDSYGVPHVTGQTKEDLAWGAGWVTARDRGLLLQLGRGPSRVAVADVPGINAFGLVTSGQSFVPSAATEQLVTDQVQLIRDTYGARGEEMLREMQAEADGMTAYFQAHGIDQPPATVNDVIAVTAFIGSIFGAGGGAEASNAEYLARLQNHLGADTGRKVWEDTMLFDDPEAPTTLTTRFDYPVLTGGAVTGSAVIDEGSIQSLDPRQPASAPATAAAANANLTAAASTPSYEDPTYPAAGPVPHKEASNFLVVDPGRTQRHRTVAVMGPQLGYYYPEIVQQIHLSAPGVEAQGVGVPAAMMYILIGRTRDYAWSLTSANQDVRDVFAEQLCNPDGSAPTRASDHYRYQGVCRPFEQFDAGTLNGTPVRYPVSVHGPVIGTATSNGTPIALSRKRSTFGRDGLNLGALKDMTDGAASTPEKFWNVANEFGFTFNWAYASRTDTAYFASGYLPKRASGLDRRLPTWGTGEHEWQGVLSETEHPHSRGGPGGLLLNWNNQSAPGFMHGDDNPYGSVHRVEQFNKFPDRVRLRDDVGIMNRAATQDTRSLAWPAVSRVLRTGGAPNALDQQVLDLLDDWVRRDAPLIDADNDGTYDEAGPTAMNAVWNPVANAVVKPVLGDQTAAFDSIRGLGGLNGESIVDKDLRTLLGDPVQGAFRVRYCGAGSLAACRASLWAAVDAAARQLVAQQGPDPAAWRSAARRQGFTPGLIPDTFRATNRPTFQQVIEWVRRGWHGGH